MRYELAALDGLITKLERETEHVRCRVERLEAQVASADPTIDAPEVVPATAREAVDRAIRLLELVTDIDPDVTRTQLNLARATKLALDVLRAAQCEIPTGELNMAWK